MDKGFADSYTGESRKKQGVYDAEFVTRRFCLNINRIALPVGIGDMRRIVLSPDCFVVFPAPTRGIEYKGESRKFLRHVDMFPQLL